MEEKKVKDHVKRFLNEEGYYVPRVEFSVGVRPDVVAFKWRNEYEIEAIAVECKRAKQIRSLTEAMLSQAREYQLCFPKVYLATPIVRNEALKALKTLAYTLRIGLLSVQSNGKVERKLEPMISPRLNYDDFLLKVRQRAAAILTYKKVVSEGKSFNINVQNPLEVHCYVRGKAANFLLSNWPDRNNYYFGVCIEQKENVRRILGKITAETLHKLISGLPKGYLIDLDYIHTYKPREVLWPILRTETSNFSKEDTEWLLKYCKQSNWKVQLIFHRKVWHKYEILSKNQHEERVRKVKNQLRHLRETLIET